MGRDSDMRVGLYRKDERRETLLKNLNEYLASKEIEEIQAYGRPRMPVIFVVGAPRSGSTVCSALMARTGALGYVSNFVARFWLAPYLGARIEEALGIRDGQEVSSFDSDFGVTEGWGGPHEFGYFWNRWFPFGETHALNAIQSAKVDRDGLKREVAALEAVYERPMFFKSLVCSFQVTLLAEMFPTARFVICRREPLFQAQSLLLGRERILGDRSQWLSLRPKEYSELLFLSCYEQVVAQIHCTLAEVDRQLAPLEQSRWLELNYEDLCVDPRGQLQAVLELAGVTSSDAGWLKNVPHALECTNKQSLPDDEWNELCAACRRTFGAE